MEQLWTVADAARELGVDEATVLAFRLRDGLPFVFVGLMIRFIPDDVRAWAAAGLFQRERTGGFKSGRPPSEA